MKKKLVQNSSNAYMVILPKWWADKNHLKKGDTITLDIYDNDITISAEGATTKNI
jgi:antitoxin component of MazEF toxin-antitoxin module